MNLTNYGNTRQLEFFTGPTAPKPQPVTDWQGIVRLAPSVLRIIADARKLRRDWRNRWEHYEWLKGRLQSVVGWAAPHPSLRSCEAYDVAHRQMAIALGVSR